MQAIGQGAVGIRSDVSKLSDLDRLYDVIQQQSSQLDILVANAGGGSFQPVGAITEEEFDKTFAINVKGTLFTVQKALPILRDGASIILTSSTSTTRAIPGFSVHSWRDQGCDSKLRTPLDSGLEGSAHPRQRRSGPGPTLTPGLQGLTSTADQWRQLEQQLTAQVPAGRIADPREIGRAVVFLASNDSSFVNGVELFVDGGMAQI